MKTTILAGGMAVELCHQYEFFRQFCRGYETDAQAVFSVSVTEEQLAAEMALSKGRFSRELCEATCLHRELVKQLVPWGIILIHSAVVAVDGEAYVFLAKSGVGKSTHIRLWREALGPRAVVVNGDKPFFSFAGNRLMVHGSPWKGKEHWGQNISLPVKAFCLLERGTENEIAPASSAEVVNRIFHQVLVPTSAADVATFLAMMGRITQEVPFFRLRCNMEPEAALVAYEGMRKERI